VTNTTKQAAAIIGFMRINFLSCCHGFDEGGAANGTAKGMVACTGRRIDLYMLAIKFRCFAMAFLGRQVICRGQLHRRKNTKIAHRLGGCGAV
jgi:hypothetical protein